MASIFTRIINGELPGRFVWKDDLCVAFLSIHPLRPGHTLVIPREEVDHWLELDTELMNHLMDVAQQIGKGIHRGFKPVKVGMMIAGLEVPHVHIHLVPIETAHDLDFENQNLNATQDELEASAQTIRASLRELGYQGVAE